MSFNKQSRDFTCKKENRDCFEILLNEGTELIKIYRLEEGDNQVKRGAIIRDVRDVFSR